MRLSFKGPCLGRELGLHAVVLRLHVQSLLQLQLPVCLLNA
jgi:hypothetical protein